MFLYDKFCHCASNERWKKQSALFLYETIDALQQMTTAGYFNGAKLDLNLGDLIFATVITEQEKTTYDTYILRVIGLDENVVVESVEFAGGTTGLTSVAVDSSLQGNGTASSPIGLSQVTQEHLETIDSDLSELGEQVSDIQTDVNSLTNNISTNSSVIIESLSNGYIRMSGKLTEPTIAADGFAQMPVAFPDGYSMANADYFIQLTGSSAEQTADVNVDFDTPSTTGFNVDIKNLNTTTAATNVVIHWVVFGLKASS